MAQISDVVIASGVRTAVGAFGGSLKDLSPTDLGARCIREAVRRAGVDPAVVGSSVFGNVIQTEPKDAYLARTAAVGAGLPITVPALTLNRLCGSGIQAMISVVHQIVLGDVEVAVAGGAECMSRAPYAVHAQRWGQKMGDVKMLDMLTATLTDPFGNGHMGITAENVATKWKVSRDDQDAFALESQHKATAARADGRFKDQILPIEIESRKGTVVFDQDEYIRPETTLDGLKSLKPVFKQGGTVTAGNASGINDGASALVLMSSDAAGRYGVKPLARIVGYGHAAVEPSEMGIGPIPAVQNAMRKTGLSVADMDVIESNEAFASQAIAVARDLKLPMDRTNPNGGAIAIGHPVGATGAILTVKTIYELKRIGKRYGLITMCIGGGQGIALIIENLN
ncbi:MAG: acetyl-CoA C-acyltransferase [Rhodospirillaceae bacterium]|nr:MAG: acetyl-CoA C-acyltransferase [Rhodospirillaceae bacterium]